MGASETNEAVDEAPQPRVRERVLVTPHHVLRAPHRSIGARSQEQSKTHLGGGEATHDHAENDQPVRHLARHKLCAQATSDSRQRAGRARTDHDDEMVERGEHHQIVEQFEPRHQQNNRVQNVLSAHA